MLQKSISIILLLLCCLPGIFVQETTSESNPYGPEEFQEYDSNYPHCFRFTWLGSSYDNTSEVNGTCKDLADKFNLKHIPCQQPLVITYDATPPNITYLWENHRSQSLCRAKGRSCVKYLYYFNNQLKNATYMCANVISENEGPVTSGCYSNYQNGYETKVCVCKPQVGPYIPCNSGETQFLSKRLLLFVILNLVTESVKRWKYLF